MRLERMLLPVNNRALADYWSEDAAIHSFFQYKYSDIAFVERALYLQKQLYDRNGLAETIRSFMQPFGISVEVEKNLQALQKDALVIVGGQQAGLLTGPLYSLHKAITVLLLAKQQSEKLKVSVVPLFWIAGEDHDLEEINHIFTTKEGQIKKRGYSERSKHKTTASSTPLQKDAAWTFIEAVFKDYGETEFSANLLKQLKSALEQSKTFTDFFVYCMNHFFAHYGLLMLDAAYKPFRQLQSPYFEKMIKRSEEIAKAVVEKEVALYESGYGQPIEAKEDAANLFYVEHGERFLLERRHGQFVNLNANIKLTEQQLLMIAKDAPEHLSNNVVTRPLMQEMTIPVLAFVGGPGELAYWATLKDAFTLLDLQMPIFAPRLNITYITRQVEHILIEKSLSVADVFVGKEQQLKKSYLESITDQYTLQQLSSMEQYILERYEELGQYLENHQLHLDKILIKNKNNHLKQFSYFSQKVQQAVETKHAVAIRQYDTLTAEVMPNGGFQERAYAPFQYLNQYGPTLIDDLLTQDIMLTDEHMLIYL